MVGLREVDAGRLGAWESTQADEMGNQRYVWLSWNRSSGTILEGRRENYCGSISTDQVPWWTKWRISGARNMDGHDWGIFVAIMEDHCHREDHGGLICIDQVPCQVYHMTRLIGSEHSILWRPMELGQRRYASRNVSGKLQNWCAIPGGITRSLSTSRGVCGDDVVREWLCQTLDEATAQDGIGDQVVQQLVAFMSTASLLLLKTQFGCRRRSISWSDWSSWWVFFLMHLQQKSWYASWSTIGLHIRAVHQI